MGTAKMEAKVLIDSEQVFYREITLIDGIEDSIQPSLLGFNQKLYQDAGALLKSFPPDPREEVIEVIVETEILYDTVRVHYNQTHISGKRFIVQAAMWGIREPVQTDIVDFIKGYFVE